MSYRIGIVGAGGISRAHGRAVHNLTAQKSLPSAMSYPKQLRDIEANLTSEKVIRIST